MRQYALQLTQGDVSAACEVLKGYGLDMQQLGGRLEAQFVDGKELFES